MLPRRPACAVSLTTLPQECLIQICALLPARTLTTLSACSALLQRASSDDLLWLRLCQIDYGVDARHCLPAFPYTTVRGFYVGVLQKWGWTLGAWQANYPFFTGQLLHVRVDPLYSRIVGEKLTVDISGLDETSAAPVAPLPGVSMDKLAVQLERKAVFEIRFEKAEHVDSSLNSLWSQRMPGAGQSPLCTRDMLFGEWDDNDDTDDGGDSGSSSFVAAAGVPVTVSTVAPVLTHVDAPPASPYDQEGVVSYTTCCGAKINTPTLRSHVGTVIDAWDSFSVFQTSLEHFPLFRPSVDTGLWPYPESSRVLRTEGVLITMFDSNEPPLAFNRDEAETLLNEKSAWRRPPSDSVRQKAYPALLSLMCRTKCHDYGVRTVTLRAPEGKKTEYDDPALYGA
ncbi:hypothetical protein DFJ77DRAFT_199912 [Powellomyces hirtus]|nr:hypothetical protein DFJ77DRAFT_199912 [Powellomyces hirtus]